MVTWQMLFLSLALLAGNICVARRARILNGFTANIEDFPWQASLREFSEHVCGGSIISERHILTAGHCIVGHSYPPYTKLTVVTGTTYKFKEGNSHKVANVTVHPDFFSDDNRAFNDIAVITLKDKILFDSYQKKIKLPKENFKVGQKVILSGWGLIKQPPDYEEHELLQQFHTEIISLEKCQQGVLDPENMKIYETEVCTNNPNLSGMCLGDSGGPLADWTNDELIGIASWTDGPVCGGGYPDVYTNVYAFKDFIESVVNETV